MPFIFDLDIITLLSDKKTSTSGVTGTTNYIELVNKPMINGVTLSGNKTTEELGIISDTYGIKGDYCSRYGIVYAQYGLVEYESLSNEVIIKAGIQLIIPNKETKTLIGSDIKYEVQSIVDVTLFFVEGEILEAEHVYYQVNEPPEDGQYSYIAWWNPEVGFWQFKSNDTGNVWREANGTPIADIHFTNESIVRIDHVGYRHLNTMMFATQDDLDHTATELEEIAEELGSVSNIKLNRDLSNITDVGISAITNNVTPTSIAEDGTDFILDELQSNTIYHCGELDNLIISNLDSSECVPESIIRFTANDNTMMSLPSGLLKLSNLDIESGNQYVLRIYDKMVTLVKILGLTK